MITPENNDRVVSDSRILQRFQMIAKPTVELLDVVQVLSPVFSDFGSVGPIRIQRYRLGVDLRDVGFVADLAFVRLCIVEHRKERFVLRRFFQ